MAKVIHMDSMVTETGTTSAWGAGRRVRPTVISNREAGDCKCECYACHIDRDDPCGCPACSDDMGEKCYCSVSEDDM